MTPRAGWVVIAVAVAGCALHHGNLPGWVERPPQDDTYLYAVGTRTGAPTMEEARRGAVEQAVAELTRRFGTTSQSFYNEVRTQLATQVRDEIQSQSPKVEIKGALVQNWYVQRTSAGYDAFVLVRYPREQAEREQARQRSQEAAALHAAEESLRRGDAARERDDIAAAITAYLEAAGGTGESAAAVALQTQAAARLSSIASSLQLDAVSGDAQRVRPLATAADPLVVRAVVDGKPVAGMPLRLTVEGGQAEVIPAQPDTGSDGTAAVTVRARASAGVLIVRAAPDIERLRPKGTDHFNDLGTSCNVGTPQIPRSLRSLPPLSKGAGAPAAGGFAADVSASACPLSSELLNMSARIPGGVDATLRAIAARTAEFRLSLDSTPRPLRLAVLIDERDGDTVTRRSIVSALVSDHLREAGFRVVSVQELGRTNAELLQHAFDREQFIALSADLAPFIDVAVGGWCETRPGSENQGWATSVLADANVKAVELTHGEVIAAHSVVGRVGFGEREDRARMEALKAAADELAEALAAQMAAHMDTSSDRPAPDWKEE
jgi:hypothetical protein